jgi:5-methylcytosine-specific restriction endonuclease McrA
MQENSTMAKWPYSTVRWQRLRKAKLVQQPYCSVCNKVAHAVDHIMPISKGGDPFPPLDALRSLCTSCHSKKTWHIDRKGRSYIPIKGVDAATGKPLDPKAWWGK